MGAQRDAATRKNAPVADNHYQVTGNDRAWFYTMPTEQCRSQSVFLVPGDIISTQEQSKDDFIEAVYYTADRHIVRGWLKKSQLQPLNSGDNYRYDINPLSTDEATRVATLSLRPDYQCIFYESWNAKKAIEIIVREDHQTALCRGGPTHKRRLLWLISVSTRPAVKLAGQMLPKVC
jgi:hypothetical protein